MFSESTYLPFTMFIYEKTFSKSDFKFLKIADAFLIMRSKLHFIITFFLLFLYLFNVEGQPAVTS